MAAIKNYKTEWDLKDLLLGDDDPAQNIKLAKYEKDCRQFINRWKEQEDYLVDPIVLKTALNEYEDLMAKYSGGGEVGFYFALRNCLNQNDPKLKAKDNKITDLTVKIGNELEFFTNRLSKVSDIKQKEFISSPYLKEYKHFLETLFLEAKHLLSESEEKVVNLMSGTAYSNWIKMTSDFLSKEERNGKSFSEIYNLIGDRKKAVRDSANKAFNEIISKHSDVAEAEINSILQSKKVNDELRGYKRPDTSRHISDDIDTKTIDALLFAVESRYDISKRYYRLKAGLFKVKKLKYHERNVDYGEIKKKFSFDESVQLAGKSLEKLDGDFYQIFTDMLRKGCIDVYPKKGKESSEFCINWLKEQPAYILLNHSGMISDVTTLTHEMGHAINDEMVKKKQNFLNMFTPVSTAEVASTFMQDFVLEELSKGITDKEKLTLSMIRLNDAVSSVIRQVACYKFELELHEKFRSQGYLSKQEIGSIFQKHMQSYMGEFVEQSKGSENWWIPWSHIRRFFYVYSYASGNLISQYMRNQIKKDPRYIDKVKEFLSAGSSCAPKEIFARLGINIEDKNFWLEGLKEIDELLTKTERLAKKLKKI